jgi:ABC-type branched-subunit amino acid transport system substrate-binding protein
MAVFRAAALITPALLVPASLAVSTARAQHVEVAAALSITGEYYTFGTGSLEGIQLALEEANTSGAGPLIDLKVYDDKSTDEGAKEAARRIVAGSARVVLGPTISTGSLAKRDYLSGAVQE